MLGFLIVTRECGTTTCMRSDFILTSGRPGKRLVLTQRHDGTLHRAPHTAMQDDQRARTTSMPRRNLRPPQRRHSRCLLESLVTTAPRMSGSWLA